MKHLLTKTINQEIAQAILRGEVNYAYTLQDMDLVRTFDNVPVRPYTLNANQVEARNFIIRCLRDTA